ncbi:RICIN domain-containing protein [Kitasatospora sp. NPDC056184]|uniref:RICIN domain-containing protein n=1 Tax=Kitasatospora sp. NPDC056184 TaxID=3345738 RepID=UPI0035E13E2B
MTDPAPTHRRRTRAALLALTAALATALPIAGTGTAHAEHSHPTYPLVAFVNAATGKCLEVADVRKDDGAPVRQWTCTSGNNQKWTVYGSSLINLWSGKCLDIPGFSTVWGTRPIQWTCTSQQDNQRWLVPDVSAPLPGYLSSLGLVLDVAGFDPADGATVATWGANGGANQLWYAVPR